MAEVGEIALRVAYFGAIFILFPLWVWEGFHGW